MATPRIQKNLLSRRNAALLHMASFVLALLLLAGFTLIAALYPDSDLLLCGVLFSLLYLVVSGTMLGFTLWHLKRQTEDETADAALHTDVNDIFRFLLDIPYAISDKNGHVAVVNESLQKILGVRSPIRGMDLSLFCPTSILRTSSANLSAQGSSAPKTVVELPDGKRYYPICHPIRSSGRDYFFILFDDATEYLDLRDRIDRESLVVAYLALDNLQEIAQYVRVNYQAATLEIGGILRSWAAQVHGLIREYDRDKYLMLFSAEELEKAEKEKFPILNTIRAVKLGDNSFPVTVSIGISSVHGTMEERERAASDALQVAFQRGGDQVVLRTDKGLKIYGGHVNTIQANSSIPSRVNSDQLCAKIAQAGNVIIMGHRLPDFDAIGATVGLARLAIEVRGSSDDVRIVTDTHCPAFGPCFRALSELPEHQTLYTDGSGGLDLVRSDTLLIVCDVNNMKIVEAPDIVAAVDNVAIIDHHRQYEVLDFQPALGYIFPTASSACELVAEMLEQSRYANRLLKEEANVMLSGIMLDTKNFTHNTGSQTFSAVHYLYERGAHTNVSRTFFDESLDEIVSVSDFGSRATTYRPGIVITWADGEADTARNRVHASKVADQLLAAKDVHATFALVFSGNAVNISARSDGKINVQLILEKLGGGGHFDMAGAQLRPTTVEDALARLQDAIDEYLRESPSPDSLPD